jgi:hypothetical protein
MMPLPIAVTGPWIDCDGPRQSRLVHRPSKDLASRESDAELGLLLAGIAGGIDALESASNCTHRGPADRLDAERKTGSSARHPISRGQEILIGRWNCYARSLNRIAAALRCVHRGSEWLRGRWTNRSLARRYYLRALEITPERLEAWLGLARLASREGQAKQQPVPVSKDHHRQS